MSIFKKKQKNKNIGLTDEEFYAKHDTSAKPSDKLWKARVQILNILRENDLHIELGADCIAGVGLWLCENIPIEKRNVRTDADLMHYMELHGCEKYLKDIF